MAKVTDLLGHPHSGVIPWAVVGIVTDNVDPDELGRIQVKFPTMHAEPLSFWIRQASPNAGAIEDDEKSRRGLYALPEKEDEVIVLFMQGSQDLGVIIGQFWNGIQKPPREAWGYVDNGVPRPDTTIEGMERATGMHEEGSSNTDKNDRRFWKSRSGHLIVFDDTEGKETFQIWDHTRKLSFVFDGNTKLISMSNMSAEPNATDQGIQIRTSGDLQLEAAGNIWLTAKKNMDTLIHEDVKRQVDQNVDDTVDQNYTTRVKQNIDTTATQNATYTANQAMSLTGKSSFAADTTGQMSLTGQAGIVETGARIAMN